MCLTIQRILFIHLALDCLIDLCEQEYWGRYKRDLIHSPSQFHSFEISFKEL